MTVSLAFRTEDHVARELVTLLLKSASDEEAQLQTFSLRGSVVEDTDSSVAEKRLLAAEIERQLSA